MSTGLVVAVLAIGSTASGTSGFGFALISVTLLSFFINVKTAVVFLVIHTLTQNIIQFIHLRKHFSLKPVIPLLAGSVLGVPPGVLFLKSMDPALVQKALGVVVILFVLQSVLKVKRNRPQHHLVTKSGRGTVNKGVTALIGTSAGMLMGAFLSGGPPIVMYAVKAGGSKYQIKATMQSFFLFSNIYSFTLYSLSGLMTADLLLASAKFLPVSIIGTMLGIVLFRGMSTPMFNKLLYAFLLVLGFVMAFK